MKFDKQVTLGRTQLRVGRLGISSSFGAPVEAYREAFERGLNYFTWGTFIKGRAAAMRQAIREIIDNGQRENLVLAMYNYSHISFLTEPLLVRGLKKLNTDYADVLILGYYPQMPSDRILNVVRQLKEKGLVRFVGLSGHNRPLFARLESDKLIDVYHVRYNAAHRGAEQDVFPHLSKDKRTGVVSFTATRWRQLLQQKNMPEGERAPSAVDCYRFVLSHPAVDVCMSGTKNLEQMRENLKILETGPMSEAELERMRKIGDYVYNRNRKIF